MEAYSHRLVLHIDETGNYVLLRDNRPVTPAQFEGRYYVPLRLGTRITPSLTAWNIDGTIVTQSVFVWETPAHHPEPSRAVRYSVLIVCSHYARRLQAALQCIAHQRGCDIRAIEVVLAYVPGVDPTDDVLDSFKAAHPDLRIVRVPFSQEQIGQKGFMINEAVSAVSGEWVVLLDADILVPPDLFAALDDVADDTHFIAPNGRKMLPPDVTAKVLLGEIQPWNAWQDLLQGPGEFRFREVDGVPIGFLQCVRRKCLQTVRYDEYGHFEGADWKFGVDIRKHFGKETRLSGHPVLHLDHGGSQWYGTRKQY